MSVPLHVLMPTDVFPPVCGGAGWSAHALAQALIARGHTVTALVPRQGAPLSATQRLDFPRTTVLGVPVVSVPYYAPHLPIVANWYRHEWFWPLMRNVLIREARRAGARTGLLIYAQHVQTIPGAVLAGRELAVPVVATVRDHWPCDYFATGLHGDLVPYPRNTPASLVSDFVAREGPLRGVLASIAIPYMLGHVRRRQALLAEADAVVTVSRYMSRRLPEAVPPARVQAIPNIVDVAAIDRVAATPPALDVPPSFLLFVGKLEYNKGAHLLPAILAAARAEAGDLPPLVVLGGGSLEATLRREIGALGGELLLPSGWTDHDEVLRLMRRAEVLLFPSTWGEPLSRVLLEASAAGACIAAMPTGGTPEVIEDGRTGVLAADADALGRAVGALLRHPARADRLRSGARQRAREAVGSRRGGRCHGGALLGGIERQVIHITICACATVVSEGRGKTEPRVVKDLAEGGGFPPPASTLLRCGRGLARLNLLLPDRVEPAPAIGHFAAEQIEEGALDLFGDRATPSRADLDAVDRAHGCHFGRSAGEEELVRDIERLARQTLLDDFDAQVAHECHHRVARNTGQHRCAERRGDDPAVAHEEEVLSRALAHEALRIEQDALAIADAVLPPAAQAASSYSWRPPLPSPGGCSGRCATTTRCRHPHPVRAPLHQGTCPS